MVGEKEMTTVISTSAQRHACNSIDTISPLRVSLNLFLHPAIYLLKEFSKKAKHGAIYL